MDKKISGVFAAVPTPFTENDEPDVGLFLEHCEWVIAKGCDGLNVLGSTGEANSQGRKSRAQIMRSVADSSFHGSALMVGTGTPSLADTIELTELAAALGFDAALVLPPYYYKPLSDDGLFNYFSRVVESVRKTSIGIYLYNFPQMTGLSFSAELVARLLEAYPTRVCGMKDSSGDMAYTNRMAATFSDRFDVFPGSEAPLPDAKEFGYAGCISASVNATVEQAAKVWRERDAVTEQELEELRELRAAIASVPIVAAVKALVAMRTGRAEWRRMLPPLVELSGDNQQKIRAVADRLGFLSAPAEPAQR
ncbi:MAG: dihydrodipicolinate synthase family protein [Woeseiaceae bacterium]